MSQSTQKVKSMVVVTNNGRTSFNHEVNSLLDDGYTLHGPLHVTDMSGQIVYTQALILLER